MAKRSAALPSTASKIFVVIIVILGLAFVFTLATGIFGRTSERLSIDEDLYQAVTLSDGRVLFGNLSVNSRTSYVLDDVYYIEDGVDADTKKAVLLKHSSAPYGPQGSIVINRDQVLFWENLEDTGLVTETIMKNNGDGNEN